MGRLLTTLTPTRRWMQLSLRTVLVLVTLFCVALSLWVVPAERQRWTVAAIEALGGRVRYADRQAARGMFVEAFSRRWLPQAYLDEVDVVDLDATQVTDAGLARLQGLTNLRWLHLDHTQVTNAGLAHLQRLTSLESLSLRNTQVTDAGLVRLQGLTGLKVLYLDYTQVTDAGAARLRQALPGCRIHGR